MLLQKREPIAGYAGRMTQRWIAALCSSAILTRFLGHGNQADEILAIASPLDKANKFSDNAATYSELFGIRGLIMRRQAISSPLNVVMPT